MNSVNYFRKRAEQRMKSAHDRAIGPVMNVSHHYRKSVQKLSNDVQHLLNKVATSPQEARDLLNEYIPNDEYKRLLEQFKTTKNKQVRNEIKQRLKAQAVSHRIRRKEALISAIERERLARIDHQLSVTERFLSSIFKKQANAKATDFGLEHFAEIDTNRIKQVLKENWLGSNYSKRIWSNQQEVANQMQEKIMQQFMTGQPPKKIMQEMLHSGGLVETDIYKYNRLLRTETSYVVNRADLEVSKKLGIEKRKFVATLDSRTSSKCREQHNKIVYIKDTVLGVNTPPLHPFCRSIMVDYIPGLSDDSEWDGDFQDFTDDFGKAKQFLKMIPKKISPKGYPIERIELEKYFKNRYFITELPKNIFGLDSSEKVYITKSAISYISLEHNNQKTLDYIGYLKEVIDERKEVYFDYKKNNRYLFYKRYQNYELEIAIEKDTKGNMVIHFLVGGYKKFKNKKLKMVKI